jgi:hypothetical protein
MHISRTSIWGVGDHMELHRAQLVGFLFFQHVTIIIMSQPNIAMMTVICMGKTVGFKPEL